MFRWLISSPSSGTGNEGARENTHPVGSHPAGGRSSIWEIAISECFVLKEDNGWKSNWSAKESLSSSAATVRVVVVLAQWQYYSSSSSSSSSSNSNSYYYYYYFISVGSTTPVGFGLINCRRVFSAGRCWQSAVASGTSNPQLGVPVIRTFQLPPQASPSSGRWNYGREMAENFAKVATSMSLSRSFTCRKVTTWDRRLYFPSEGRRAENFFARKIRRLLPGLNPQTRVPKAK
jgi:hypothetical protein